MAKTNSSIIKEYLYENLNIFQENNYYPLIHQCHHSSHDWLRQPIENFLTEKDSSILRTMLSCTTSMCLEDDKHAYASMLNEYKKHDNSNVILTSDFFSSVKDPENLLKDAERKKGLAVVYVDNQANIIEKIIAELVLDPLITIESAYDYALQYDLDFYDISQRWSNISNFNPCQVYSSDNNVISSLMNHIHIQHNHQQLTFPSTEDVQLSNLIVLYLYDKKSVVEPQYWLDIVNFFKNYPFNHLTSQHINLLKPDMRLHILQKYHISNLKLMKQYPHVNLFLSNETNFNHKINLNTLSDIDTTYLDKVFKLATKFSISKNKQG